ncbi:unnamed protein product [Taenia asiatica]|uniref:Uncharacterized protein n=1 Tax=Taenia asiatica TaxID=60517 RepID=A0A3P6NVW7_TAEAS|nr:unnamed protein product [Taenia asiatica]
MCRSRCSSTVDAHRLRTGFHQRGVRLHQHRSTQQYLLCRSVEFLKDL